MVRRVDAMEPSPLVEGQRPEQRMPGHRPGVDCEQADRGPQGLGLGPIIETGAGEAISPEA